MKFNKLLFLTALFLVLSVLAVQAQVTITSLSENPDPVSPNQTIVINATVNASTGISTVSFQVTFSNGTVTNYSVTSFNPSFNETYINTTNRFSTTAQLALDVHGISYNAQDDNLYLVDSVLGEIFRYSRTGSFLNATVITLTVGSTSPEGITNNGSTLFIVDSSGSGCNNDDVVYKTDQAGNNLTGAFSIVSAGSCNPTGITYGNKTDLLYVYDVSDNFVYAFTRNGTNTSNGFNVQPQGITSGGDFKYYNDMFYFLNNGNNQLMVTTLNGTLLYTQNIATLLGASNALGISTNGSTLFIDDATDDVVSYVYINQTLIGASYYNSSVSTSLIGLHNIFWFAKSLANSVNNTQTSSFQVLSNIPTIDWDSLTPLNNTIHNSVPSAKLVFFANVSNQLGTAQNCTFTNGVNWTLVINNASRDNLTSQQFHYNITANEENDYNFTLTCNNFDDATKNVTMTKFIQIDDKDPILTVTLPAINNQSVYDSGSLVPFNATCSDRNLFEFEADVYLLGVNNTLINQSYYGNISSVDINFSVNFSTTNLSDGDYMVTYLCGDDHTLNEIQDLAFATDDKDLSVDGKGVVSIKSESIDFLKGDETAFTLDFVSSEQSLYKTEVTKDDARGGYKIAYKFLNPDSITKEFTTTLRIPKQDDLYLRDASIGHFVMKDSNTYIDFQDEIDAGNKIEVRDGDDAYYIDIYSASGIIDPFVGNLNNATFSSIFHVASIPTMSCLFDNKPYLRHIGNERTLIKWACSLQDVNSVADCLGYVIDSHGNTVQVTKMTTASASYSQNQTANIDFDDSGLYENENYTFMVKCGITNVSVFNPYIVTASGSVTPISETFSESVVVSKFIGDNLHSIILTLLFILVIGGIIGLGLYLLDLPKWVIVLYSIIVFLVLIITALLRLGVLRGFT